MPEARPQDGPGHQPAERHQLRALIAEIWMLVDYIAGSSSDALSKAVVANPQKPGTNFTPAELLRTVSDTDRRLSGTAAPEPYDRAEMQIVRDALNVLVRPASGLTVAYTTMVVGPMRRRAASRYALAQEAYANLTLRAFGHRWLQSLILIGAVLFTGLAAWESAKVALGKALLQNLDMLRTQQASLGAEKLKLELSMAPASPTMGQLEKLLAAETIPLAAYRLCDRALVLLALTQNQRPQEFIQQARPGPRLLSYATAEERDVCGRDDILRVNLGIVHQDLIAYSQNWPGMAGSAFALTRNMIACGQTNCGEPGRPGLTEGQKDVEFRVAPILLVWGNFVLPIIFSSIGSAIFVLLDHYNKVRGSILHPRDAFLAPVRLALGLVVGACVGLFFSAYGPVPPAPGTANATTLISSLTLSASGVAFLAGFGVETVFSLLEAVISRFFSLPAAQK